MVKKNKNQLIIDEYILKDFGTLDLAPEVRLRAKRLASKLGIKPIQALEKIKAEGGSVVPDRNKKKIRNEYLKNNKRVKEVIKKSGIFSAKGIVIPPQNHGGYL